MNSQEHVRRRVIEWHRYNQVVTKSDAKRCKSWHWRRYVTWPVMLQRFGSGSNVSFQQSLLTLLIYRSIVTISLDHDLDNSKQSPNSNVKYWNCDYILPETISVPIVQWRSKIEVRVPLCVYNNTVSFNVIQRFKVDLRNIYLKNCYYLLVQEKHQGSYVTKTAIVFCSVFTTMCVF